MKRLLYSAFLVFTLTLMGCDKETAELPLEKAIVGEWELRLSIGGWSGRQDYPAGNGTKLLFTKDTYKSFSNGNVSGEGAYKIIEAQDSQGMTYKRLLRGDEIKVPNQATSFSVEVKQNLLTISMVDILDGVTSTYVRIK